MEIVGERNGDGGSTVRRVVSCDFEIAVDAVADAASGGLDGVAGEMGIAGGGLDLRMAQELADIIGNPSPSAGAREAKL